MDTRDWQGHVVVFGVAGVALRTVEQLRAVDVPVVVIDDGDDLRHAATLGDWGVPRIGAGVDLAGALQVAGVATARAVVCASEADLRTLEAALAVRDERSDVRVVVHIDNPAVGRAIEEVTGVGSVLDVAGLFAPSVVRACSGERTHALDLAGERFAIIDSTPERDDSLRELYADLVPIAVEREAAGELLVCPGRDERVRPGDRVTLLGGSSEVPSSSAGAAARASAQVARRARRRLVGGLFAINEVSDRAVRATIAVLTLTTVVAAIVLDLSYHQSDGRPLGLLSSLYFAVETVATVGFGDFSFAQQSPALRLLGIVLIIAGTALVSILFALLTNALVARRIEQSLGRGQLRGVSDHVVLVGLGSVGMRVLEGLVAQGREAVVIEYDEDNRQVNEARALGVRVVIGDATLPSTLQAVRLADAGAIAVLTSDDLTNLEVGLAVRDALGERWFDVPVVLRVFDRALGHRLQESFDFRHVWSTSALAAPWFVGAVLGFGVLATFYVANVPFLVARLEVSADGGLVGMRMRDLGARIRVIAISRRGRDTLEHPPRRDTRFAAGDEAFLAGPYEELLVVVRRELSGEPEPDAAEGAMA